MWRANITLYCHSIIILCICIFPQNHTRFLDIKMKYNSYERMTMLSTDFQWHEIHYLVVFSFHDPTNIFMLWNWSCWSNISCCFIVYIFLLISANCQIALAFLCWVWITVGLCFVLQRITRSINRASFYSSFALSIKASCFMPVIPQRRYWRNIRSWE